MAELQGSQPWNLNGAQLESAASVQQTYNEGDTMGYRVRKCYCEGHCPNDEFNGTCEVRSGGKCFTAIEQSINTDTGQTELDWTYGCLQSDERGVMQCKATLVPHKTGKAIACCDDYDHCNQYLKPKVEIRPTTKAPTEIKLDDNIHYIALLISVTVCVTMLFLVVSWIYVRLKRRERRKKPYLVKPQQLLPKIVDPSSGSGSGMPTMVQRTISKQIQMVRSVGKGRYGEVWLANWRGENVAVKIFITTDEASWFRETEIYQTVLMRHENILGFVGADIKGTGSWTQMLLITDYHEIGSLHDYLQSNVLDPSALLTMALSIASGLSHLHTEICGAKGKPAIAHRDIKSKNILVKRNGQCAIADFGLAVRYLSDTKEIDIASNTKVGTKRYMAPEVLNETLNVSCFDAFKMADMYSLGLVLWEMSRRCVTGDKVAFADDYALPYYDCVSNDPSFDDMRLAVCVKKVRPQIPVRWETEDVLQILSKVMHECWHENPAVRLTALRVKKTLSKLDPDPTVKIV